MTTQPQIEEEVDQGVCQRHYEAAQAYENLNMPEEARAEYAAIPPESPNYAASQGELVGLLQAQGYRQEASELGLSILKSGIFCHTLLLNTSLALHLNHRFEEAFTLLFENLKLLDFGNDVYSIATAAARTGNWEYASKGFLYYLRHDEQPNPWFFLDTDVEPWFDHLLDNLPFFEEAENLAHPRIRQRWLTLPAPKHPIRVDTLLAEQLPREFQAWLKLHLASGHLEWDYHAPADLRARYLSFQQHRFRLGQWRLECLVAKAEALLQEWQLPWAAEHAMKGNFYAARFHTIYALTQNPHRFHEFEQKLRPLGMGWLFDDIQRATQEDPQILKKLEDIWLRREMRAEPPCADLLDEITGWHPRIQETGMFLIQRGHTLEGLGKDDEAMRCWLTLIKRWPSDPSGFHSAARLMAKHKKWNYADQIISRLPAGCQDILPVEELRKKIADRNMSQTAVIIKEPFYGQRNLGGALRRDNKPLKWLPNHKETTT